MKQSLKHRMIGTLALCLASFGLQAADTPITQKNAINGTMSIQFNTRVQADENGTPPKGVTDEYKCNFVVADTTVYRGLVSHQPSLFDKYVGMELQGGFLKYALDVGVRNPKDLTQEKIVGKMAGSAPINKNGEYLFNQGDARIAVDPVGKAAAFESRFAGTIAGKKPVLDTTLERAKKQTITLSRMVNGKTISIKVDDYDPMKFMNLVIPAGPAAVYPAVTVSGEMVFDYARSAWYFYNLTLSYSSEGKTLTDKISGNIKWIEDPNRLSNGIGQYDFNVRVNEDLASGNQTEDAAFAGAEDESAFFSTDDTVPSLTGLIKYKDSFLGETVSATETTYNLDANKLSKAQIINLFKLICLVGIIPMNAE